MVSAETLLRSFTAKKLLFNIIFWVGHWGVFAYGWYSQATNKQLSGVNALAFSIWISRGAGLVLSLDTTLILLPMCRNLMRWVRPTARWLPLDESIWFHRQLAYAMLTFTVVHTAGHYINFFNIEASQIRPETAAQIHYTQPGPITGHVMLLCMLLIYTTAHSRIRQQSFETFWYTHHLFIPFFLGLYTHTTGCFVRDTPEALSPFAEGFWDHCLGYMGWRWELWTGGLYFVERIYREIRARRATEILRVIQHPSNVVEIQFRKPNMKYKAGQWLFLNCPEVSPNQWHPFTITSCPFDPYISVHVRQVGDFTQALGNAVGAGPQQVKMYEELDPNGIFEVAIGQGQTLPCLRIDGPYGAPAEDITKHQVAVIIGAGIGVTPWAANLKQIWNMRQARSNCRLLRLEFVWLCRDISSLEWFRQLLLSLEAQDIGGSFLNIHIYLTQKMDSDAAANIMLNTAGRGEDAITKLRSGTQFGRPDFENIFVSIREQISKGTYAPGLEVETRTTVGVYFCGPGGLAKSIRTTCKEASDAFVLFKLWKEHF